VAYLKLHGCLDHIYDRDVPLILSREQYATHSENRTHLFERLRQLARESTVLFIGYRLDDPHIRELIYKLETSRRPRWYIVTPDAEDYDINFWSSKNIEVIKARFGQFMQGLDAAIPPLWRSLSVSDAITELPLRKFYVVRTEESEGVKLALENDLTHVHAGMSYPAQTPEQFYSGYDTGWGSIILRFDARRKIEEELLFTVLLENENPKDPLLVLVRRPGGSGKSIALKRTAFEAATASNALVLWLNEAGALRPEVFFEIYELTKATIFLFVDQLALTGAADTILILKRQAGNVTLHARGRDIEEKETACQFDKNTCRWRLLGEAESVYSSGERMSVTAALMEADAEGLHISEIMAATQRSDRNAIDQLLYKMQRDGEVVRVKRGQYATPGKMGKKERSDR
jgi:hypothetical protein